MEPTVRGWALCMSSSNLGPCTHRVAVAYLLVPRLSHNETMIGPSVLLSSEPLLPYTPKCHRRKIGRNDFVIVPGGVLTMACTVCQVCMARATRVLLVLRTGLQSWGSKQMKLNASGFRFSQARPTPAIIDPGVSGKDGKK
ncbi:hypothetical protein M3J09_000716 [Ascochyta lentis]